MNKQDIENLLERHDLLEAENLIRSAQLPDEELLPLQIRLQFLRGNHNAALNLAEQMIRDFPDSPIAYRWKAEILDDGFHEYQKSIEFSSKAIELDPHYADAYIVRGNTKRWMKPADNKGAIKDYNTALQYDKNNPHALTGIGWALLDTPDQRDEALQKFTIALSYYPKDSKEAFTVYQGISAVFFYKKNPDKAIEYINKAIEINPAPYYLYSTRALYKTNLKNPPGKEICNDYCLAFQKIPCKKDFDFPSFFEVAYTSGNMEKVAGYLWENIDMLPIREDILDFHILLVTTAKNEWLDLILHKGLPMNYQSTSGRIYFHELINLCDVETIRKIQVNKNLLKKVDQRGYTPLAHALSNDKIEIGKYLLSIGSSPDERIFNGLTPFSLAIMLKKTEWIELFLKHGVDLNNHSLKISGQTCSYLAFAALGGHQGIVKQLLAHGADPNRGMTHPLTCCNGSNGSKIADLLLAKGAKPESAEKLNEDLQKKRLQKIKMETVLNTFPHEQKKFHEYLSSIRQDALSIQEWNLFQKALKKIPKSPCEANSKFALNILCNIQPLWENHDLRAQEEYEMSNNTNTENDSVTNTEKTIPEYNDSVTNTEKTIPEYPERKQKNSGMGCWLFIGIAGFAFFSYLMLITNKSWWSIALMIIFLFIWMSFGISQGWDYESRKAKRELEKEKEEIRKTKEVTEKEKSEPEEEIEKNYHSLQEMLEDNPLFKVVAPTFILGKITSEEKNYIKKELHAATDDDMEKKLRKIHKNDINEFYIFLERTSNQIDWIAVFERDWRRG
ncbi:MAG: hypothetical protein J6W81_03275 [Lentisphaeria bacterium]|nr:hypothetical protein [Lentisphaeria bacterium]